MNTYKISIQPVNDFPFEILEMQRERFTNREYKILLSHVFDVASYSPSNQDLFVQIFCNGHLLHTLRAWTTNDGKRQDTYITAKCMVLRRMGWPVSE